MKAFRPKPDAPRAEHEWYARLFNYFWIPCLRCGRWWGGHEESRGSIDNGGGSSTMTCCPNPENGLEPDGQEERKRKLEAARERMRSGATGRPDPNWEP